MEDKQIEANQPFSDLARLALGLLLFESIGQFDGREKAGLAAMMLNRLDTKRGRETCLPVRGPPTRKMFCAPLMNSNRNS